MAPSTRGTYRIVQISLAVCRSLQTPWTVAEMATRMRLSESHLRRLFAGTIGRSPHQWLTDVRLQAARQLLAETDLSVKEITAHIGAGDVSHFTRNFRRRFGVSPARFREIAQLDLPQLAGSAVTPGVRDSAKQ